ncbi:MAG TPA: hypothetical protein VKZ56_03280 [Membranihabitans sp.]|nr:hypothetical protein [Membranihabitans sp.]
MKISIAANSFPFSHSFKNHYHERNQSDFKDINLRNRNIPIPHPVPMCFFRLSLSTGAQGNMNSASPYGNFQDWMDVQNRKEGMLYFEIRTKMSSNKAQIGVRISGQQNYRNDVQKILKSIGVSYL